MLVIQMSVIARARVCVCVCVCERERERERERECVTICISHFLPRFWRQIVSRVLEIEETDTKSCTLCAVCHCNGYR